MNSFIYLSLKLFVQWYRSGARIPACFAAGTLLVLFLDLTEACGVE